MVAAKPDLPDRSKEMDANHQKEPELQDVERTGSRRGRSKRKGDTSKKEIVQPPILLTRGPKRPRMPRDLDED